MGTGGGGLGDAGKGGVLESHAENRAVRALVSSLPEAIMGAKFDRKELTLSIAKDSIRAACEAVKGAGYTFLEDVTCVDWYPSEPRFQVTYHILSMAFKERVRLVAMVDSMDASIDSITGVWPAANFYEREVWDLFGVRFHGHPGLRRIMMPEEWEGHPLRKDYPVEGYR
jgi:NADH-quinone oxidoreductase subunit C